MSLRISNLGAQSTMRTVTLGDPDGYDRVNKLPYHAFDAAWMDDRADWFGPLLDWLGFTRFPEVEEDLPGNQRAYGETTVWPEKTGGPPLEIADGIFVVQCTPGFVRLIVPGRPGEGVA